MWLVLGEGEGCGSFVWVAWAGYMGPDTVRYTVDSVLYIPGLSMLLGIASNNHPTISCLVKRKLHQT